MANDATGSLAARAEERFFTLDHVGVVRHFEGVEMREVQSAVKAMLGQHGAGFEDALEELKGRMVYTNISKLQPSGTLTLWLKATLFEGVGVVIDAKLFHSADESAFADEELSRFVGELEERVLKRN